MHHLVERGRDEAGESHHVRPHGFRGVQNSLRRHHHAEVLHLEVVALQHHADDVLADVVDVALHRGHHDPPLGAGLGLRRARRGGFLRGLNERHQVRHRLLHHPGALHHLGEEHLAGAEQIAHRVHAVHQRSFDHVDGALGGEPGGFRIRHDVAVDAAHEGVAQAFGHRRIPPRFVHLFALHAPAAVALGHCQQPLGGVLPTPQHGVLYRLAQVRRQLLVDGQLPGVDDAHGQASVDGVVEEDGMDRFAHLVVAAEGKRNVADAAGGVAAGKLGRYPAHRVDEVAAVCIVGVDAGGDGEDVGVEDDVLRRQAGFLHQQAMAAPHDGLAAFQRIRLPVLVEGHHHHRGAVALAQPRLFQERGLAGLEADGVDDALALHAAQAGLDHAPIAGIDHHRHPGDVRFAHGEMQEPAHGGHAVGHAFVHVHVDDLGAALHLLPRHVQRRGEIVGFHQTAKLGRTRHVGALADVDEERFAVDAHRLQPGQRQRWRWRWRPPRRGPPGPGGDGADVFRRGAAAAPDHVHQAPIDEFAERRGHLFGRLVVAAEGVWQAGVRVDADERAGDRRQRFDVRPQRRGP